MHTLLPLAFSPFTFMLTAILFHGCLEPHSIQSQEVLSQSSVDGAILSSLL